MFHTDILEKIETARMLNNFFLFFPKSCCLWDNVDKFCTAVQARYDNMAHAHSTLDT